MSNKVGPDTGVGEGDEVADPSFQPGTAMNATSTIEISISCRNLANKDVLSKSDPICIVYNRPFNTKTWVETLRTEIIENNLNPDFIQKLTMEYRFEQAQNLRFEIYDIDSPSALLDAQDGIGFIECTVANIVSAGAKGFTGDLESFEEAGVGKNGSIVLIAEELASLKDEIFLKLSGGALSSCMDCWMAKSFYVISKCNDGGNYLVVYRSQEIRGANPIWESLTIPGRNLCNGDKDRQLKIEAFKKTLKGEDAFIGLCYTTLNRMSNGSDERLQLMKRNGQPLTSSISVLTCTVSPVFTFLDFVQAGTKIHLCFSIDFTSSNGDPTHSTSLHHISPDPKQSNAYEQAIAATGNIVKDYDNTNIFPVYGFGARIPPVGDTSHLFPVTLGLTPNCRGIDGVLRAYKSCIPRVQLFGPTNFAPIITRLSSMAQQSKPGQHYYVLVIITDGVITDMPQTKEALIKASYLPVSIVIVGVGESDFGSMEELDGDGSRLTHNSKVADRDIVQFVEYRSADSWLKRTGESTQNATMQALNYGKKETTNLMAQGQLAEEILAEIPIQLTGYMKSKELEPSMIVMEPPSPEEAFHGSAGPDVEIVVKEKVIEKPKKKLNPWGVMMMVSRGKSKFRALSPPKPPPAPLPDPVALPTEIPEAITAILPDFSNDPPPVAPRKLVISQPTLSDEEEEE